MNKISWEKRNQFFVCESLTIDSNFENDYFSSSALLFYVPYSVYVIYPLEINKLRFRYTDNEGRNVVGGWKEDEEVFVFC